MFNTKAFNYDGRGGHVGSLRAHRCGRGGARGHRQRGVESERSEFTGSPPPMRPHRASTTPARYRAATGPLQVAAGRRGPAVLGFCKRSTRSVARPIGARGSGGFKVAEGDTAGTAYGCPGSAHACLGVGCLGFVRSVPEAVGARAVAVSSGGRRDDWDVSSRGWHAHH